MLNRMSIQVIRTLLFMAPKVALKTAPNRVTPNRNTPNRDTLNKDTPNRDSPNRDTTNRDTLNMVPNMAFNTAPNMDRCNTVGITVPNMKKMRAVCTDG